MTNIYFLYFLILIIVTLFLTLNVEAVSDNGKIYIRSDGSIDPPLAPISTSDSISYIFTGDIFHPIVIERDSIILDGDGYTLQGTSFDSGINLSGRTNVTVRNIEIKNFNFGISIGGTFDPAGHYNIIEGNIIKENEWGISLIYGSSNNEIVENTVKSNVGIGIRLSSSTENNIVRKNSLENNGYGIHLEYSDKNDILDNNITKTINNGIRLRYSDYNNINKNVLTENINDAMHLIHSSNNIISDNVINENNGDGLHIRLSSNNNNMIENIIENNYRGISLYGDWPYGQPMNNNISKNVIESNNNIGIWVLSSLYNSIIENTIKQNNGHGIFLEQAYRRSSNNNNIVLNKITSNKGDGISMPDAHNNDIMVNNIENNDNGIFLRESSNNIIRANYLTNNNLGVFINESENNVFYHNNIITNKIQVKSDLSLNYWDDDFPSGGNYWSDYEEIYPDAEELEDSGIWDTPYVIKDYIRDRYPLINPYVIPESPSTPILVSLKNNATGLETDITISWQESENAEYYSLQISDVDDFSNLILDESDITDTQYEVNDLADNTLYYWRVRAVNAGIASEWSDVWNFTTGEVTSVSFDLGIPTEYLLFQNYPNPFNPVSVIRYGIPERSNITLSIFNVVGQKIATIVSEEKEAGFYEVTFDASHIPSGTYIYRIKAGEFVDTKKMLLLR